MTTTQAVAAVLANQNLPKPSTQWLNALISSQRPNTPLTAVSATAKVRLLSSDITAANLLDASAESFPPNLTNPAVKECKLSKTIFVQLLGIEDLSRSRWDQIEAIEAFERGEGNRGREIVRVVAAEDGENGQPVLPPVLGGGPHQLVLQDAKGQRVFALELKTVAKVGLGMGIGTKIMLKGVTVARGMVLLEPATAVVLGGKIEALHKNWTANRKKELMQTIEATGAQSQ
ncbi:MAG: hypothetical protein M1818_003193 [Claussenomyces sp. TS43310]|nr:MAG: hypothetical protein M1818_003193 [Claussenomyces sp. TS43310]